MSVLSCLSICLTCPVWCAVLQPLSELTPSDSERIITVSGGRDKVLRAVALILNTVRKLLGRGHCKHAFHQQYVIT